MAAQKKQTEEVVVLRSDNTLNGAPADDVGGGVVLRRVSATAVARRQSVKNLRWHGGSAWDAGGRRDALQPDQTSALLHRRHQHPLHFRRPRRHCGLYWAFGDELLTHSNAFSLLPESGWRDAAWILMLIHQFITFGFACMSLYFVWEKVIGMHDTRSLCLCLGGAARLPVVVPIWFLAIIFPFFGPINSAVGALLVSFTVYIIPAAAHMLTYRTAAARQNAVEKLPFFLPSWTAMYAVKAFIAGWVLVVGFGIGGWASMTNFVKQVDTFGLFAKCYQCLMPPPPATVAAAPQRPLH